MYQLLQAIGLVSFFRHKVVGSGILAQAIFAEVLCLLSRSRRVSLPCVFCRDPDCLSLVLVWYGRIGFSRGFSG